MYESWPRLNTTSGARADKGGPEQVRLWRPLLDPCAHQVTLVVIPADHVLVAPVELRYGGSNIGENTNGSSICAVDAGRRHRFAGVAPHPRFK